MVTTRQRLANATAKLEQAQAEGSDLVEALQTGVDKTRAKLLAAEEALQQFQQADSGDTAASPEATADPAALAIEKAMAARQAAADLSPGDKARDQLDKFQQRLEKSRARLATSRSSGEEQKIIEALESTVSRLEDKIAEAKEQLTSLEDA